MAPRKIRVLIVDDSAFMRQLISSILSNAPDVEIVGTAPDPLIAREKIKAFDPDVITLDIEMPKMDGLEFLRRLMSLRPTRVLMISSLTKPNTEFTLRALQIGAVDWLEKPVDQGDDAIRAFRVALLEKIQLVASARLTALAPGGRTARHIQKMRRNSHIRLIAMGASTGGVEALTHVMQELPAGLPPIAIVQHMPPRFTTSFAQRMNTASDVEIVEAEDGMDLVPGRAAIAPGGYQFAIRPNGDRIHCSIFDGAQVSGHAPSVDVLFESMARYIGGDCIGVILTGMGQDGARGLLAIRRAGGLTLGQDEQSSLVYGMPRVAEEIGAVTLQLPLSKIAEAIVAAVERSDADIEIS